MSIYCEPWMEITAAVMVGGLDSPGGVTVHTQPLLERGLYLLAGSRLYCRDMATLHWHLWLGDQVRQSRATIDGIWREAERRIFGGAM